jgi:uncharacterized protein YwgA
MKPIVKDLVLALLTRVKERGGAANKTKLLKLLYLADIEHFRKHGETLSGFDWIFYLYGPWSAEYDSLLEELVQRDLMRAFASAAALFVACAALKGGLQLFQLSLHFDR